MIKTYNFTVDFEQDIFDCEKEEIRLVQNDNLSSKFVFEFQDALPDYCHIVLKAMNESTSQLVEMTLPHADGKAEMLVERIMLLDEGRINMSLSLHDGDTVLTNLTFCGRIKIKKSLMGNIVGKVRDILYYDILTQVQELIVSIKNYYTKPETDDLLSKIKTGRYRGAWTPDTPSDGLGDYLTGDTVLNSGINLFMCTKDHNKDSIPALETPRNPSGSWISCNWVAYGIFTTDRQGNTYDRRYPIFINPSQEAETSPYIYTILDNLNDRRGLVASNNDLIAGLNTVLNTAEADAQSRVDAHNNSGAAHTDIRSDVKTRPRYTNSAWSASVTYAKEDIVRDISKLYYKSKVDNNLNHAPSTNYDSDNLYWECLNARAGSPYSFLQTGVNNGGLLFTNLADSGFFSLAKSASVGINSNKLYDSRGQVASEADLAKKADKKTWRKITDVNISSPTQRIILTTDSEGKAFNLSSVIMVAKNVINDNAGSYPRTYVMINNTTTSTLNRAMYAPIGYAVAGSTVRLKLTMQGNLCWTDYCAETTTGQMVPIAEQTSINEITGITSITALQFLQASATATLSAGTIEIWGLDA